MNFFSDDESERARAFLNLGWTGQAFLKEMEKYDQNPHQALNAAYVDMRTPYRDRCIIYGCVALAHPDYYRVKINKNIRLTHTEAARRAIHREQKRRLKLEPCFQ